MTLIQVKDVKANDSNSSIVCTKLLLFFHTKAKVTKKCTIQAIDNIYREKENTNKWSSLHAKCIA